MIALDRFEILTFDCYGTLIDWESGILNALRPVLQAHGHNLTESELLERYAQIESIAQRGEYRPYREILAQVMEGFGQHLGFSPTDAERACLAESLPFWQPFPDTVAALKTLQQTYKLAILSNIDDDLFAHSMQLLQIPFHEVITAQQARSYKPSHLNFRLAMERLHTPPERILHVAQSLYHDIVPARQLGLATVWVNRRHAQPGFGATIPAAETPDLEVPDLQTLAALSANLSCPPH